MKWVIWICLGALIGNVARADEYELDMDAVTDAVNEWAGENLDENFLKALQAGDRAQVQQFLTNFQSQLQGDSVLDLAALKTAANTVLPLLEMHPETQPYAAWLATRLDYLEVAEELNLSARATTNALNTATNVAASLTNVPAAVVAVDTNPPIEIERQVWKKKLAARPLPKGAQALVEKLKPVFAEERIPPELIWIAEVESSFDSEAKSPIGAAGLFQLMPATAREYGLRRWPRDQRYQPVPSSRAAAKYLFALHRKFKDWPLAVAAYNAGAGNVQRLLDRQRARTFEEIAPKLPAETQMFVPKVEGVLLRREGKKLAELTTDKR